MNMSYIKIKDLIARYKRKIAFAYRLYIKKDPSLQVAYKWFKDRGDTTLRLNYPLNENSIVFDLGGFEGDFADQIYKKFKSQVYIFEPVRRYYAECSARFAVNPKIHCFGYGLSNVDGEFPISNEQNGSSLIKNNTADNLEIVMVRNFSKVLPELGVGKIDLLKLNIEGAEFDLLNHVIDCGLIANIKYLQVQFHDFYPNAQTLRDEIRKKLAKTHKEQWNYPFVWESWQLA